MGSVEGWFWFWVIAAAFFIIGEIFTVQFFMLPFGVGAAAAAVVSFFDLSIGWQWAVFIAVSAIAFLLFRRFADHLTHEPPQKTGVDRLIGKVGVVIEELEAGSPAGQVRIEREEWRADAPGFEPVPAGTRVIVDRVEGTHLIVRPHDSEVQ